MSCRKVAGRQWMRPHGDAIFTLGADWAFDDLSGRRHYVRPAPALPLLAFVFAIALVASILTLVLSAVASTSGPVVDPTAVRAGHSRQTLRASTADEPRAYFEAASTLGDNVAGDADAPLRRADPATLSAIITNAAREFGQDPAAMIAVAMCESSLRSDAVGDGGAAVGLFQFHRDTFTANARRLFGHEVDEHQRLDPVTSSLVAAWMWSQHQQHQWTCAHAGEEETK